MCREMVYKSYAVKIASEDRADKVTKMPDRSSLKTTHRGERPCVRDLETHHCMHQSAAVISVCMTEVCMSQDYNHICSAPS